MSSTILLKQRPQGEPTAACYETVDLPLAAPKAGEVHYETLYLSVDPYLRGRMNEGPSYIAQFELNEPIVSGFVGRVLESKDERFKQGDLVSGMGPWAEEGVATATTLQKLPPGIPPSAFLGVLGMPGLTAYVGLFDIAKLKDGETVVVSAASGAVGSLVVQLAKLHGCRVIGIAGGKEKCTYVREELGADACLDHRKDDLTAGLRELAPNGVDVDFENVGGKVVEAVCANLAVHSRIALCGLIADYNATSLPVGPSLFPILKNKASIHGFVVLEHWDRYPAFLDEVAPLVASGKVKFREDVSEGLASAPDALLRVLNGKNFGKQVVKVRG